MCIVGQGKCLMLGLNSQDTRDGSTTNRYIPTPTASLGLGRTATALAAGERHTCALLDDGSAVCWGANDVGQFGDGTNTGQNVPTQTSGFGGGRVAVAIAAGNYHTCALLTDGNISCWGANDMGQLGDGTSDYRYVPTQTSSLGNGRTAVALDAGSRGHYSNGDHHTCAILDDGTVSCWGSNSRGQVGDGTTTDRAVPTQTGNLDPSFPAVGISLGGDKSCSIVQNGEIYCWGGNSNGELGIGSTGDRFAAKINLANGVGAYIDGTLQPHVGQTTPPATQYHQHP